MSNRRIFSFSRSGQRAEINGPQKVFQNLRTGLSRIGWELVEGRMPPPGANIWIHDDWTALYDRFRFNGTIVIGPNLAVLPQQLPRELRRGGLKYIQPSLWAAQMWCQSGFAADSLVIWPVGINTEQFVARDQRRGRRVLIYFKERYHFELQHIEELLRREGIQYRVLRYGAYTEPTFKDTLSETSWCIWIGRHESQGIALQEVLASDIPVLVWEATFLFHAHPRPCGFPGELSYLPTQSAPYFDTRCGLQVREGCELGAAIVAMNERWREFSPRSYVEAELGLEKQARAFVNVFGAKDNTHDIAEATIIAWRSSLRARINEFSRRARAKLDYWRWARRYTSRYAE